MFSGSVSHHAWALVRGGSRGEETNVPLTKPVWKWNLYQSPCPYWHQAQFPTVIWECFLEPWSSVTLSNEVPKWWCKSRVSAWFLTPAVRLFKCKSRTISHSEPKNYLLGNALDSGICPLILCAVSAHWSTRGITGAVSSCNNASRIIWSNGQANNTWW